MAKTIWVKVRKTQTADGWHCGPDLGPVERFLAAHIPSVLNPSRPDYGHPETQCCRVTIYDEDEAAIRDAGKFVADADVPPEDVATLDLEEIFAAHNMTADTTDALVAKGGAGKKRVLLRAAQLGLAPDSAEVVRLKHGIPSVKSKDGIDADIHEAASLYVVRKYKLPAGAADEMVKLCVEQSSPLKAK